jgi:hypothetical protein
MFCPARLGMSYQSWERFIIVMPLLGNRSLASYLGVTWMAVNSYKAAMYVFMYLSKKQQQCSWNCFETATEGAA